MWHGVGPISPPAYYAAASAPRRWVWFGIGAGSMLALGVIGLTVMGLLVSLGGYHEDEYFVDQARVERAVDQPCVAMKSTVSDLVLVGKTEESVASLKAFTATIGRIVDAIDGAKPNGDARAWRDDWMTLATSLDAYAAKISAGESAPYSLPRSSSGPITDRMYDGSPQGCEVPTRIDMLDPKVAEDYDEF